MKKYNPHYDTKIIGQTILTILFFFVALKVSKGVAFVLVVPFMLMALFTNRVQKLLFWILFTNILVVTNDFFAPKGFVFSLGYRALLTGVGLYGILQFFSVKPSRYVLPLLALFGYLFYMIIPSIQGWAPRVACLKLILFSMSYMTFAFVSTKAQASKTLDMRYIRSVLLAFCIVYIAGSLLVAPFPRISLMNAEELLRSGSVGVNLYKGMTNHSQTMGMFMCCWAAFLLGDLFFNIQKPDKLYIGLVLGAAALILKTSSRTAMGTLLAGVVFLTYCMMQIRGVNSRWKSKVVSSLTMLAILAAALVIAIPSVRDKVAQKAMKWGGDGTTAQSFNVGDAVSSRAGLVEYSLYLWNLRPTIGWGFQVSPEIGAMEEKSGGFVLSAPVEKGVWVTAILEEGGVFGEIIYIGYVVFAFWALMIKRAYMGSTVFLLIHVSNLGEFSMFSMSGVGCIWYGVMFVALIFDAKRLQGGMGGPAMTAGPVMPPPMAPGGQPMFVPYIGRFVSPPMPGREAPRNIPQLGIEMKQQAGKEPES